MNFLIQLLGHIGRGFAILQVLLWELVKLLFKNLGLGVITILVSLKFVYDWAVRLIDRLLQHLDVLRNNQIDGSLTAGDQILEWLGIMDCFLPMGYILGGLVFCALLWTASLIYRFLKSWIPTVN